MFTRLMVVVTHDELCALRAMSEADIRSLREQLRFLLREEARRRGLLEPQSYRVSAACLPERQEVDP
jgi:hypothetical protein